MEKPTWKNTLYSNHTATVTLRYSLDGLATAAMKLGYPYIEWNGRILLVNSSGMHRVGKSPDFPVCNAEELDQSGGVARWCGGLRPIIQDIKLMAHDTLRAGTTLSEVFNGHLTSALMAVVWPDTGNVTAAIEASLSALDDYSLRGSDPDGTIAAAIAVLRARVNTTLHLCERLVSAA